MDKASKREIDRLQKEIDTIKLNDVHVSKIREAIKDSFENFGIETSAYPHTYISISLYNIKNVKEEHKKIAQILRELDYKLNYGPKISGDLIHAQWKGKGLKIDVYFELSQDSVCKKVQTGVETVPVYEIKCG